MSEAGVTVVKRIAEFRWKCPRCGFEERYEPDDYDIQHLFDGTFSTQCWECGEVIYGTFNTVKREKIVRCRDCLRVSYDGVLSTGWCNENCREVRPDDFCSWGERKSTNQDEVGSSRFEQVRVEEDA